MHHLNYTQQRLWMCWFSWNCFVCSYVHFLYILWMQATGKKKSLLIIWFSKSWFCLPSSFAVKLFMLSFGLEGPTLSWCVCCFPTRTCWSWSSPAVGQRVDRGFTPRVTRNSIPSQIASPPPNPPQTHTLPVWSLDYRFNTWPGSFAGPVFVPPQMRQMENVVWYHRCFERKATI